MKYAALLLMSTVALAQDMKLTTVHGHMLGESLKAYVARTPHAEDQVQQCRTQITTHKRPEVSHKWSLTRKPRVGLVLPGQEQQAFDECAELVKAVDAGGRVTMQHAFDKLTYEADALVKIETTPADIETDAYGHMVNHIRFEDVVSELVERWGQPKNVGDLVTQNGFGATFHHRSATWEPVGLYITAFETDASLQLPGTALTIETRQEHERELAVAATSKKALD